MVSQKKASLWGKNQKQNPLLCVETYRCQVYVWVVVYGGQGGVEGQGYLLFPDQDLVEGNIT